MFLKVLLHSVRESVSGTSWPSSLPSSQRWNETNSSDVVLVNATCHAKDKWMPQTAELMMVVRFGGDEKYSGLIRGNLKAIALY